MPSTPHETQTDSVTAPLTSTHRLDIDGLRAVAVLSVVLFHAFPDLLPGGFVGVDVFFVISGYLITRIIRDGLHNRTFSLLEFYRKRIHRIFPALIVVLAASLLLGFLYLSSDEFQRLGKHTFYGALFSQNFNVKGESGYFDIGASKKPLLHLWTLSIEEQFYVVYPLLAIAIWRRGHKLLSALALMSVASFVLNIFLIGDRPITAFYFPGSRAWELLAGGIVATLGISARTQTDLRLSRTTVMANLVPCLGLAGLCIAIFGFGKELSYPGWWALVPVLGSAVLLASDPSNWAGVHLLSHKLMVYIGQISYPLYLWHWPLLSFWCIVEPEHQTPTSHFVIVVLSCLLASFTYHMIEKKIRHRWSRSATAGLVGSMMVIAILGALVFRDILHTHNGVTNLELIVHRAITDWKYPGSMTRVPVGNHEAYIAGGGGSKTLFWGDSHMEQYAPRILDVIKDPRAHGRGVIFLTAGGEPPLPGVVSIGTPHLGLGFVDAFNLLVQDKTIDTVVIAARWNAYFSLSYDYAFAEGPQTFRLGTDQGRERAATAFDALLTRLASTGKRIYLVHDNPTADEFDPAFIYHRGFLDGGFRIRDSGFTVANALAQGANSRPFLMSLSSKHHLTLIDPIAYLKIDGLIPSVRDHGEPIYKDTHHLRASYVRDSVRYLDQTIDFEVPTGK